MNSTTMVRSTIEHRVSEVQPRTPGRAPRRGRRTPLLLLAPAAVVLTALIVVPVGFLAFTSFTDFDQRSLFTGEFDLVGFDQYVAILRDPEFWAAALRTLYFTGAMVVGSVVVGVATAQLMTRLRSWMRTALTIALVLAWAMPTVASSQVWLWLFQPGFGVVNWLITRLRVFGDVTDVNWAQSSGLALVCIWLLIVWQAVPLIALTVYAAQTQVNPEYLEAARLDGATEWRIYWQVVLPFLRPTIMVMTVLSTIWDFNVFNQIWLISQGGPGHATTTLGIYTYQRAFVGFDIGNGAAIAIVTTVLLIILSAFYVRSLLRSGEDL